MKKLTEIQIIKLYGFYIRKKVFNMELKKALKTDGIIREANIEYLQKFYVVMLEELKELKKEGIL